MSIGTQQPTKEHKTRCQVLHSTNAGPTVHNHPWKEAYVVLDGVREGRA